MSYILYDEQEDLEHCEKFHLTTWQWIPILQIIQSMRLIDQERFDLLDTHWAMAGISADEARQIAAYIRSHYLDKLGDTERLLVDLSSTSVADDGTFYKGAEHEKNFSVHGSVLREFCEFCERCNGFWVA